MATLHRTTARHIGVQSCRINKNYNKRLTQVHVHTKKALMESIMYDGADSALRRGRVNTRY